VKLAEEKLLLDTNILDLGLRVERIPPHALK
jgi:hypothetical protein